MYRKSRDKDFKRAPRNMIELESPSDAKMPVKENAGQGTDLLSKKSLMGLPKTGSSLTVKADPYALTLPSSDPYALLNALNTKAGGQYAGDDNLDGGITNQLITSELSNFLHVFDSFMVRCKINYRYLPIKPTDVNRGAGFVREMIQAIDEVISIAKSTTYTNLAINSYYIKSDLPRYNNETGKLDNPISGDKTLPDTGLSCGTPQGLYQILICYQTYLQSFASVFNAYNKFRAYQGCMMNMSWNRETPALNSYFTLMNKNAMVGQFKSLAYLLNGEYFDTEWMRQFNLVSSIVSRKSNAMVDPMKEVIMTHNLPKFKLYLGTSDTETTVLFDSSKFDELMAASPNTDLNKLKFSEGFDFVAKRLSINDTLYWVRNQAVYNALSEQSRFNIISDFVNIIQACSSIFKPAMGDLRTMLDVVQRVGCNSWSKSTKLEIFNNLESTIVNNLTVDDLYHSLLSGSKSINWDGNTFRWTTYTIWDYYFGIPEYDSKSGGCFLTFSTKEVEIPANYDNAADYLPVFISDLLNEPQSTTRGGMVYAINRLGTSVELAPAEFDPSVNPTSARLVPLKSLKFNVKIPYTAATLDAIDRSHLQAACLKAFGSFSNGSTSEITASTDLSINPDYLCYITVEINDLTNEMITYSRSKGPFIVNFTKDSGIGFLGLEKA